MCTELSNNQELEQLITEEANEFFKEKFEEMNKLGQEASEILKRRPIDSKRLLEISKQRLVVFELIKSYNEALKTKLQDLESGTNRTEEDN